MAEITARYRSGGKQLSESIIAIQEKDIDTAWETFATAGKALQTWNTYPTAEGVKEGAEAGSKRIQPFVSKAAATAKNKLTPFFDPDNTNVIPSFYAFLRCKTNRCTVSAKLFEQRSINCRQKWNQNQKIGDYYGVDLGRVIL